MHNSTIYFQSETVRTVIFVVLISPSHVCADKTHKKELSARIERATQWFIHHYLIAGYLKKKTQHTHHRKFSKPCVHTHIHTGSVDFESRPKIGGRSPSFPPGRLPRKRRASFRTAWWWQQQQRLHCRAGRSAARAAAATPPRGPHSSRAGHGPRLLSRHGVPAWRPPRAAGASAPAAAPERPAAPRALPVLEAARVHQRSVGCCRRTCSCRETKVKCTGRIRLLSLFSPTSRSAICSGPFRETEASLC